MEKTFSKMQIASIKRTAQNVAPYVAKKEKLNAKIASVEEDIKAAARKAIEEKTRKLQEKIAKLEEEVMATVREKVENRTTKLKAEVEGLQTIINSFQGPIKEWTGGYTTEDLVTKEVTHTGKLDSTTGKEIIQTRYVLKYPETVLPPEGEAPVAEESNVFEEIEEELQEEATDGVIQAEGVTEDPFASSEDWQ